MSFLDLFYRKDKELRNTENVQETPQESVFSHTLLYNTATSYNQNQSMLLSAVFRAVELLSNSVAEMPVVVYKTDSDGNKTMDREHIVFSLLNRRPSARLNKHTFLKLIVMNMLLTGNGYSWIKRDSKGVVKELVFLPSDQVSVISHNVFDEIKYQITGVKQLILPKDMLHFILIPSHDGDKGVSVLQYARKTLALNTDEVAAADSFFRSGNCKSGLIKSDRPLTDSQEEQIKANWQSTFGTSNGMNQGGCIILKPGLSYESIQISPSDAELLESRKFSVAEISRFFGIPLSLMFDNSTNSYASQEMESINFLVHSLTPLLDKIEIELNDKLWTDAEWMQGYQVKFDSSIILRADKKSLAEYYQKMFTMGVMSPNEIRKDLDMNPVEGGDSHFMQVNLSTMDKIVSQPIEKNPTASNQIKDNQEEGGEDDKNIKE